MEYLNSLGGLALGSRLKRLSDRLGQEVATVYKDQGIDFEPRWFPVFSYLAKFHPSAITDIASQVGITHPAVNQIAQELLAAGLVLASTDRKDKRKRLLSLSAKGKRMHAKIQPIWNAIHASVSDLIEETQTNLPNCLSDFERALEREDLLSRYTNLAPALDPSHVEIIESGSETMHFSRLNSAWIERYFTIEEADRELFANPNKIVKDGGFLFFARSGKKTVGTCALIKEHDATFQIAKMAVDEAYQGMGIGRKLLDACIQRAKELHATAVTLETNTKLEAAVKLYRKAGFVPVENLPDHKSEYSRVDLVMKLDLS